MQPSQIVTVLESILPGVTLPGRYTGGELNEIRKDWDGLKLTTALAFPEIYDLGMSNLGLMVLYDIINRQPEYCAERVFVPWTDLESHLREKDIPLFSLENKRPVAEFDILAVSLPYESLYTNFLNLLDLAQLPLLSAERDESHPLVIAGGHAVFNPEPMAPFLDACVIGEGEEVILEVLAAVASCKQDGADREGVLAALSRIEGVYIPAFYQPHYTPDGRFARLEKLHPEAPDLITKRIVGKLPPPPVSPIVPYIDTVHNRAPLEIMRGCTRGCRFCQAGAITRPVRERTVPEILDAMELLLGNTGYTEVGLLSLSSSDYTQIIPLVDAISQRFCSQNIAVSLPSLRIETVSADLMDSLGAKRRSGFTLAPEAASERLRKVINKPISDQQLLDVCRAIYQRGWHTIKLYFMIGHPEETLDDVQAIAGLARQVLEQGRTQIGGRAQVNVSLSSFVPKPHTPFQWVKTNSTAEIQAKLDLLQDQLRGKGLKLSWNDPRQTQFEAWMSRGDRRLAEVIHRAWQLGARFDAWDEHFRYQHWLDAFAAAGLDPEFYAQRERDPGENLPWDHISTGVKKSFLVEEYRRSLSGEILPDCRGECYACGILPTYNELRHQHPGGLWLCPEVSRPAAKR